MVFIKCLMSLLITTARVVIGHDDLTKTMASRSLTSQLIHNYGSKTLLPRRNYSAPPTKLKMRLKPAALIALSENDQRMVLSSITKLEWRDEYLTWDPDDHCNVTKVWELTKFESSSYSRKYDCCLHEFSHVDYNITFRRQPSFYVITICFPCAALSLLLLVVFWVPHEAGEKISMATDSLLALILFQQLVATLRPPSGNGLQILDIYFLTMIILSCTTIASSVVVRSLYFGKGKGLPSKLIRKLTHSRLCAAFIEVPHTADELETLEQSISSATEKKFGDLFYDEELGDRERKWREEYEKRKERATEVTSDKSQRKKATCLRELIGQEDEIENRDNERSEEDFARELERANRKENLDMYVLMRELTKQRPSVQDIKEKEKYKREWKLVAKAIDRIVFLMHMMATIGITVFVYAKIASNIEPDVHKES